MKKTFIFLLTLSLCLAKDTNIINHTIKDHITLGLEKLMNTTPPINFASPINSSLCKLNFTCNNSSQFFEELIKYLDKIKVDELNQNTTHTLKILLGKLKEVMNYFQNGYSMTGENKRSCKFCCHGHPSLKSYHKSLQYLNRKCRVV